MLSAAFLASGTFWLGLVQALPELLKLLSSIHDQATTAAAQGQGYQQALKDGIVQAHTALLADIDARNAADASAAAHPDDDSGFDQEFQRD